jgi:hypothetical protein
MKKPNDLNGQIFNNLRVIEFSQVKNKNSHWMCECLVCGSTTEVSRPNLKSGNTKDCGCLKSEKISLAHKVHGESNSRTWKSWHKMRRRVRLGAEHSAVYATIGVSEDWDNFENFLRDMGERPEGKTLDRIDNTKGYSKENCRWATQAEQNRNKGSNVFLTFEGKTLCVVDWAKEKGINRNTITRRIKKGLPVEQILLAGVRVTKNGIF